MRSTASSTDSNRSSHPKPRTAVTPPTAATRLIALLGDPVSHSLSPQFQNAAFHETHVDGIYLALRCDAEGFTHLMKGIAAAGGGGNVTLPHKALAAEILDVATPAVATTGACNTFWEEDGRLCGDNTDVRAFHGAVGALVGDPAGARVLLIGAGGAASAALYALLQDNVDSVILFNRTPDRAHALRSRLDPDGSRARVVSDLHDLRTQNFDLVVNASSLGLHDDDPLPLDLAQIGGAGAVLDVVYTPEQTPWVKHAHELGIPAADGIDMLLRQGAASFERWWGRPAPLEVMRRSLVDVG